jgi:hypothetical protein
MTYLTESAIHKPSQPDHRIRIGLDKELREDVARAAAKRHMSISGWIRDAVVIALILQKKGGGTIEFHNNDSDPNSV